MAAERRQARSHSRSKTTRPSMRAFDEWRARGVEIAQPPTRLDFGYAFLGLDPDGNRLRVFAPARA